MSASSALLRTAPKSRSERNGELRTALRISLVGVLPHSTTNRNASKSSAAAFTSTTDRMGGKSTITYSYSEAARFKADLTAGETSTSALLAGLNLVEDGNTSKWNLGSAIRTVERSRRSVARLTNPGRSPYPSVLETDGLRISASIRRVRSPLFAAKSANAMAIVVLPSPGNEDTTPITLAPAGWRSIATLM